MRNLPPNRALPPRKNRGSRSPFLWTPWLSIATSAAGKPGCSLSAARPGCSGAARPSSTRRSTYTIRPSAGAAADRFRPGLRLRTLRGPVVWAGCSPGRTGLLAGSALSWSVLPRSDNGTFRFPTFTPIGPLLEVERPGIVDGFDRPPDFRISRQQGPPLHSNGRPRPEDQPGLHSDVEPAVPRKAGSVPAGTVSGPRSTSAVLRPAVQRQ